MALSINLPENGSKKCNIRRIFFSYCHQILRIATEEASLTFLLTTEEPTNQLLYNRRYVLL